MGNWKLQIQVTKGLYGDNPEEVTDEQATEIAKKLAQILEDTTMSRAIFDDEEIIAREELVEQLRDDVNCVDDFNDVLHDVYNWADSARIWIEPPVW